MNDIHPTAVIGRGVELGSDNTIGPFAVIGGGARIGDGNWIGAHCVIGAPPEMKSERHDAGWIDRLDPRVTIGDRNVIREGAQVHAGWVSVTRVGDGLFIMNQVYVAHDSVLDHGVTIASSATLAGYVRIGRDANVGMGVAIHQRRSVGAFAMVGMNSVVTRDLPPFAVSFGSPARPHRANIVGLERGGVSAEAVEWAREWVESGAPRVVVDPVPDALRADVDLWIARS